MRRLQISTLQQSIDDASVRTTSLIAGSRVIDGAAVAPSNPLKRIVLVLATGLIGGTGIGIAYVLFTAIVSEKLHRRIEVATALEVPVTASVARVRPLPAWMARIPVLRDRLSQNSAQEKLTALWIDRCLVQLNLREAAA